jgi:xylan 1,4-beta-xylosidase
MASTIHNPILPGFHPDPSILRVGRDFYIATSTFEWWPGVRIHHSRDLVNWQHLSYALTRTSQLDMRGNPDSCGIWAPCLSHHDGTCYLVFTNVRSSLGSYKDAHNYIATAAHPAGPWSEPVYVHSRGFDPSLFHDDDGRSWFVSMQWNHRPGHDPFAGIVLQEWNKAQRALQGPVHTIFKGTSLAVTEGPHLYRRDGWYYLLVAEGGTFYEHAVTIARSRRIDGPYEVSPYHPLLTAHRQSPAGLQRAGHASLVDAGNGQWFMAHLCGRPLEWRTNPPAEAPQGDYTGLHCPLGRETALQAIEWTHDGWPRLAGGGNAPHRIVPAPDLPPAPIEPEPTRDDFDHAALNPHLNTLRAPADASWLSLSERPGWLRLRGRESLMSAFDQSLVARRQQHFLCEAGTRIDFEPTHFQHCAGLVAYYNTQNHAYLHLTHDEAAGGKVLVLAVNDRARLREPVKPVPVPAGPVDMKVVFDADTFRFFHRVDGGDWTAIGEPLPTSMLSDEYATHFDHGTQLSFGFTGNFIGLACQDLGGGGLHADFDWFEYRPMRD